MTRMEQTNPEIQGPPGMGWPEGLGAAEVREGAHLSPGLVPAEGDARTPTTRQGRSARSIEAEERLS